MNIQRPLSEHEVEAGLRLLRSYQGDTEADSDHTESELYQNFALDTQKGRVFYESLEDQVLLDILREKARELGHSPAQGEMFWVWRSYIKKRYGKWPYALQKAGLSKAAGKGGKRISQMQDEREAYENLLAELRRTAEKLCRIPHPQEVPETAAKLKAYTDNWNRIISDAGLSGNFFQEKAGVYRIESKEPEILRALDLVARLANTLGRPPLKTEVPEAIRRVLVERCGSYRNVLFQIGLEPVRRINPFSSTKIQDGEQRKQKKHRTGLEDCCYQVLNLDEGAKADIRELYGIYKKLGHPPGKKEVDPKLRTRLQKSCGSWANAVYQLKYEERKETHEE